MKPGACMAAGILGLALVSCGTARRGEPVAGPFVPANAEIEQGRILFDRHCNKCHIGGEAGLGPGINDKPLPGFLMKIQIRVGMGAMPSFKEEEISDKEVDQIVAYLKALRRHTRG